MCWLVVFVVVSLCDGVVGYLILLYSAFPRLFERLAFPATEMALTYALVRHHAINLTISSQYNDYIP